MQSILPRATKEPRLLHQLIAELLFPLVTFLCGHVTPGTQLRRFRRRRDPSLSGHREMPRLG
jgi:hypothetical protein